ncbi:MAG: tyrosine-type recombinase/integrase [Nitrososphaera sp.]|uniref:tyrosine-type recombinase/integrase n=1 Tax=Nitrososphaera sp. TaxID=1971748 RepID=UPI003D6E2B27
MMASEQGQKKKKQQLPQEDGFKPSPFDFGPSLQKKLYGAEAIAHYRRSKLVSKFLERWAARRLGTARTYRTRLANLSLYVHREYDKMELDAYVELLKEGKLDVYEELANLLVWLQIKRHETMKMAPSTVGLTIVTAKKFLRASGVKIERDEFMDRVPLPKRYTTEKAALTKADVAAILNACRDIRLKTVVLFLASTGARATESMSVRIKDLKIGDGMEQPAIATFRPETTKTGEGRTVPLTTECVAQLQLWLKTKYRPHYSAGKFVTPEIKEADLLFAKWHPDGSNPGVPMLYDTVRHDFNDTLEMIGKDRWE